MVKIIKPNFEETTFFQANVTKMCSYHKNEQNWSIYWLSEISYTIIFCKRGFVHFCIFTTGFDRRIIHCTKTFDRNILDQFWEFDLLRTASMIDNSWFGIWGTQVTVYERARKLVQCFSTVYYITLFVTLLLYFRNTLVQNVTTL